MILHCTRKLAERLADVSTKPLTETDPLGIWHAHLYSIDRRQCLFFCHDATRYCLFLPGLRAPQVAELGRWSARWWNAWQRYSWVQKWVYVWDIYSRFPSLSVVRARSRQT